MLPFPPVTTREEADCWLWAMLADGDLTHGTKSIFSLLRSRLNFTTGLLNTSIDHLSSGTAQHSRSVERSLDGVRGKWLDWEGGRGRASRRYRLLINPAVQRELDGYNSRRQAGIGGNLFPPSGQTIPAEESKNSRRQAGRTLEPLLTLSAGAERLMSRIGEPNYRAWFTDAEIHDGAPAAIVLRRQFHAEHVETKFCKELDQAFPDGWKLAWKISSLRGLA